MLKCIFSVNPGRSGSHYLSILLSKVKNVIPFHEPEPKMQGIPLILWNRGDEGPLRSLFVNKKLPKIREVVDNGYIYSETNNAFIKGFGFLVLEHFKQEEIAVIALHRETGKIVESLLEIGLLPHTEKDEDSWMLRSDYPNNLLTPSGNSSHELCSWYVSEVYARGEKFKSMFPDVRYVEVNLEDLNRLEYVLKMIHSLELEPLEGIKDCIGIRTNTRETYLSS